MKLSIRQRLNLDGILRQQKSTDGEELMLNYDLVKKVKMPREDRSIYVREVMGGIVLDEKAIDAGPVLAVELSTAEVRRLQAVLRAWTQFGPDDVEWLNDVKDQLNEVTKIQKKITKE